MAAIGFAFDIYELLMLPLVARDALFELGGVRPGSDEFRTWVAMLFYVPAMCGGIVGLWGGYLTDKLGRRRVLTWSILCYAISAFAAGFSTSLTMLLIFRTLTFVGVCVEFVAAVAWLAELFEDPHQREKVLGYTQAFSSIGGLLVAIVNAVLATYAANLPAVHLPEFLGLGEIQNSHAAWRYTLMSGLLPALPLIIIRPFLPESPVWAKKRAEGTLRRPSIAELFSPQFRKTTIVTTLMFMCSYGVAFGALQQFQQMVGGIDEVQAQITAAQAAVDADDKVPADKKGPKKAAAEGGIKTLKNAEYTKSQEVGGLLGRFVLALLVVVIVSRRTLMRVFLGPGLILVPLVFYLIAQGKETTFITFDLSFIPGFHEGSISFLGLCVFAAGFFTVAQFSFWGNYLPTVYPVHLRGTGESFAANIGGRMLGTSFAAIHQLVVMPMMPADLSPAKQAAYAAAGIAAGLYLLNFILSFFLPEPSGSMDD